MNQPTTYIVETPSAARFGNCLIGEGATENDAWLDAYGPKPWSSYTKKCARHAWARQVTAEELEELRSQS